ncbi:AMP-binding protein [Zavarzinia compransoris]|uniref:AMP-binding protein n=1 Tax=Zavarzinia compransoris TaxID=1264899 RepID=UPI0010D413C7|nr:AMP-binding protein [Zavarzinia compransoris]TDP45584.1 crotonobetaine/carnitine-CoA ligase [Zavarzinia compransoris]
MLALASEERVVGTLLHRAAERFGDRTFLQFGDACIGFGAFDDQASQVGNGLIGRGLDRGGKVAIFMRNSLEFLQAWFGAARIGALYVPINTDYKGEILRYQLDKADVTHIIIGTEFVGRLAAVVAGLPELRHVIIAGPWPETGLEDAVAALAGHVALHDFAAVLDAPAADPGIAVAHGDPHAISFTSGTTGPSKGVLATNGHVISFARDWTRATAFREGEAIFTPLPLFHAIGAWLGVLPAMLMGGRIAIVPKFSASTYWDEVRRYKADIAHGIFSMIPILLKQPARPDDADQPARAFYIGPQNVEFERRFNCRIVEVFGATENGIVTMSDYHGERRPGSCGRPNTETFEVIIADENDEPVPPRRQGEILIRPRRPHSMMKEYYNAPEATVEAFRNLWFHTGDNAWQDEDGYVYFLDRKKDAIRRRGENISSYELEAVVNLHPAILECAAVAVASELGEDEVKLVVVLRQGESLPAADLWAYCEEKMPRFWVPRFIEFRREMPKTANQKIQKYVLRDRTPDSDLHDRGPAARARAAAR